TIARTDRAPRAPRGRAGCSSPHPGARSRRARASGTIRSGHHRPCDVLRGALVNRDDNGGAFAHLTGPPPFATTSPPPVTVVHQEPILGRNRSLRYSCGHGSDTEAYSRREVRVGFVALIRIGGANGTDIQSRLRGARDRID